MTCQDRVCIECPQSSHKNHSIISYEKLFDLYKISIEKRKKQLIFNTNIVKENIKLITESLIQSLKQREKDLIEDLNKVIDSEIFEMNTKGMFVYCICICMYKHFFNFQ